LPLSETFIKEQALALKRWQPVLVGEERVPQGLSLEGIESRLLPPPAGRLQRWLYRICRRLWLPYPPHLAALRAIDADLLHAHFGPDGVALAPYARALGLPLLVTLHGYDINMESAWWHSGK